MRSEHSSQSLHRRRFLQVVGLGISSALGGAAFAQTGRTGAPAPKTPATPAPAVAAPPDGPPPLSEDARGLAEIVRRRYGTHLTSEQLEAVTRELEQRVQGGRRLKDVKLANGDEPDFTFHV